VSDDDFSLVQHARMAARDAVNALTRPEQDILPMLMTYGKRGLGIAGIEMPDDDGRDRVAKMMVATVAFTEAAEVAFVSTAWMSNSESVGVRPRDDPQRVEKVVLVHWSGGGVSTMYAADVIRHDNRPPDLGQWEEMGGEMGGRFGDAVELGLRLAKTVDDVPGLAEIIEKGWETSDPTMINTFIRVLERSGIL
jgi:hypothetical protein